MHVPRYLRVPRNPTEGDLLVTDVLQSMQEVLDPVLSYLHAGRVRIWRASNSCQQMLRVDAICGGF